MPCEAASNLDRIVQFEIERIDLFDFLPRYQVTPDSVIDVLLRFSKGNKSLDNCVRLRFFVEELFDGHSINLVVDEIP